MMDLKDSFVKFILQLQQQLHVHVVPGLKKKIMDELGATVPAIEKIVY